jgi:hypothetical protein
MCRLHVNHIWPDSGHSIMHRVYWPLCAGVHRHIAGTNVPYGPIVVLPFVEVIISYHKMYYTKVCIMACLLECYCNSPTPK